MVAGLVIVIFLVRNDEGAKYSHIIDFYKSKITYSKQLQLLEVLKSKRKFDNIQVTRTRQDSIPLTCVVMIGESLGKHHMSLYGYGRKTTPLLDSMKNQLFVYDSVIASATHTIASLRNILTFADNENPDYYFTKPSVINLLNNIGFETYWLAVQPIMGKYETMHDILAQQVTHFYDLSQQLRTDEIIFETLQNILQDTAPKDKVIFIHLMGNHAEYANRYTPTFECFTNNDPFYTLKQSLTFNDKLIINSYDNSVLYSDFIITSALHQLQTLQKNAIFLFFPDHGEEVIDHRSYHGHNFTNVSKYMYEIPFILWESEY